MHVDYRISRKGCFRVLWHTAGILAQYGFDKMVRDKDQQRAVVVVMISLGNVGTLLNEARFSGFGGVFALAGDPLFLSTEHELEVIVVGPEPYPGVRDKAFVLDEKELVDFELFEQVALCNVVVKINHAVVVPGTGSSKSQGYRFCGIPCTSTYAFWFGFAKLTDQQIF